MSETTNPYHRWLGICPSVTHPDLYQLLGVPRCATSDEIRSAMALATNKVRAALPGAQIDQWTALLDEIQQAADCLTDPRKRDQYDASLSGEAVNGPQVIQPPDTPPRQDAPPVASRFAGSAAPPPLENEHDITAPPPPALAGEPQTEVPSVHISTGSPAQAGPNRKTGRLVLAAVSTGALLAGIAAIVVAIQLNRRWPQQIAAVPNAAANKPAQSLTESSPETVAISDAPVQETQSARDVASRPVAASSQQPDEGNNSAATVPGSSASPAGHAAGQSNSDPQVASCLLLRHLIASREAMLAGCIELAESRLAQAAGIAASESQKQMVARLRSVLEAHKEFWLFVTQACQQLKSLDTIAIDDDEVAVIQADSERLVYRFQGQRFSTPVHELPPKLALEIVKKQLGGGHRDYAKWQAAIYVGHCSTDRALAESTKSRLADARALEIDLQQWEAFLADDYEQMAASDSMEQVPGRQAVNDARQRLTAAHDLSIGSIRSKQVARDRAEELLVASYGATAEDDRYVLLTAAATAATRGGDPLLLLEILQEKSRRFNISYHREAQGALSNLKRQGVDPDYQRPFVNLLLDLAQRASSENETRAEKSLLDLAEAFANENGLDDLAAVVQRRIGVGSTRRGRLSD